MGTPLERMEALQKRIADLMADMKRVEREHAKGKKRADMLQKERDLQRVELSKSNAVKEKLEKLAREFTKENKKLKV
jgi:chromosome segregation ATPase